MSEKSVHIGLFGTFDLKNYGDLLFPDVFRHEMEKRIPGIRVTLFSPIGGTRPFSDGDPVYQIRELGRIHAEDPLSALVVGGGDIIRLDDAFVADPEKYPDASRPSAAWLVPLLFGRINRIPVLFNAPGVPFRFSAGTLPFVRQLLSSVSDVNVRDEPSRLLLAEAVPDMAINVVPDTACLYGGHPAAISANASFDALAAREGLPPRYALFQASGIEPGRTAADYATTLAQLEDEVGVPILLFPVGYVHSDSDVLADVWQAAAGRFPLVRSELSPDEMFATIGHAQWFVGTSMHGCLTAMQQGVPSVVLNPGHVTKLDGCMSMYGMSANIVRNLEDVKPAMLSRRADTSTIMHLRSQACDHFNRLAKAVVHHQGAISRGIDSEILSRLSYFVHDECPTTIRFTTYFDRGSGFSERESVFDDVRQAENAFAIDTTLSVPTNCTRMRIDPAEGMFVRILDASFVAKDGNVIVPQIPGGLKLDGDTAILSLDPQFIFEIPVTCSEISVRIRFIRMSESDVERAFATLGRLSAESSSAAIRAETSLAKATSELEEVRRKAESDLAETRRKAEADLAEANQNTANALAALDVSRGECARTAAALSDARRDAQNLRESLSWRVTAPLRFLADILANLSGRMKRR